MEYEKRQRAHLSFKNDPEVRDQFRRPIQHLQDEIRQLYHNCVDVVEEDPAIIVMLAVIRRKLSSHKICLHQYPPKYVRRWFKAVQDNRIAEQRAVHALQKKARWEHAEFERSIQLPGAMPRRQLRCIIFSITLTALKF